MLIRAVGTNRALEDISIINSPCSGGAVLVLWKIVAITMPRFITFDVAASSSFPSLTSLSPITSYHGAN